MSDITKLVGDAIRDVHDFPKQGVIFKDITTLLNNSKAYGALINHLKERYSGSNLDYVVAIDARGFIFGAALAYELGIGFVPIRKKGKLPSKTYSVSYDLEYGQDTLEIHQDAFGDTKKPRVVLIDDLLATGGTVMAALELLEKCHVDCIEAYFVVELMFLKGREIVGDKVDLCSLVKVD